MKTKFWWESKTLWLNIVGLVVVMLEYFGQIKLIDPTLLATIMTIVNFILRLLKEPSEIERSLF